MTSRRRSPVLAAPLRGAVAAALVAGPATVAAFRAPPAAAQVRATQPSAETREVGRASAAVAAGRRAEAADILLGLLDEESGSVTGLAMLAQLLFPAGRADEVVPRAERAVRERGVQATGAMQVWIRALAQAGLPDSAAAVARRWIEAAPASPAPWSELSALRYGAGDAEGAVRALREGRARLGDPDLFAQEMADVLSARDDWEGAAREWRRVLGWGAPGVETVAGAVERLSAGRDDAVRALRDTAGEADVPWPVRRAGLDLALRLGERAWARAAAERLTGAMPRPAGQEVLRTFYVTARNREWLPEARWAAGRLADMAADEAERRHWRSLVADAAFLAGDVQEAEAEFSRLADEVAPGSETQRRTLRRLFTLQAGRDDAAAEERLREFAARFPEERSDLADMRVELSRLRIGRGDIEGARRVLTPVAGESEDHAAWTALEAQRGLVELLDGRPGLARGHLEAAAFAPGGDPVRRTDAILLSDALARADSATAARLGAGLLAVVSRRDPAPLLAASRTWSGPGSPPAASSLLSLAAGALDREGFPAEARAIRERLVEAHPASPEAPGALLELGRSAAARDTAAARAWLERLLLAHPRHALAPVARRLLEEGLGGDDEPGSEP
ncbi:MAG: hypothetical protein RRA92_00075 [Gemmatimonadota bacterium]|nr:hypothetical protein [Gemmatimonadota bacterium]